VSSIRGRLQQRLLAALLVLLLIAGGALYLLIHARLLSQFDAGLQMKARLLAGGVKYEGDHIEVDFAEQPPPELVAARSPEYVELWAGDGQVVARSPSLGEGHLYAIPGGPAEVTFTNLALPDHRSGRVVALRFLPVVERYGDRPATVGAPLVLALAQGRAPLDRALETVLAAMVAVGLFLLLGVALVVTRVVPLGLAPLDQVADQALHIDARTLDVRFPESGMPEELAVICARLNQLLERLEVSFTRERRFASDVAHELRTPIAELRTAAQVALKWPEGDEALLLPLREALEIALQMDRVVSNLLALARCEAGAQEVAVDIVDLSLAARDSWRPFAAQAASRRLNVMLDTQVTPAPTDRSLLGQVLSNVFSNAVQYTPAGGDIVCTFGRRGEQVALTVSNHTEGLTADDLPHLFEPFWRKDLARSDRDHAGLGLSLVSAIAERLGIEVAAALPEPDRFALTLLFPTLEAVL
jgi:signal transduction histidine kinase